LLIVLYDGSKGGHANVNQDNLITQWQAEENLAFQGWDFSRTEERMVIPELPLDYGAVISKYRQNTDRLLDMGTGGGEFLLTLSHPHELTYATEGWQPNFKLCQRTLSPLGVTVKKYDSMDDDLPMPFDDAFFDIVINRHESFDLSEVSRVLMPGGYFITQQVGGNNNSDLKKKLGFFHNHYPEHTIESYVNTLSELGFEILQTDEIEHTVKFLDVGALVFYAKNVVWEFPEFSVKKHLDKLLDCQREVDEHGYVHSTQHRFIIVARRGNVYVHK